MRSCPKNKDKGHVVQRAAPPRAQFRAAPPPEPEEEDVTPEEAAELAEPLKEYEETVSQWIVDGRAIRSKVRIFRDGTEPQLFLDFSRALDLFNGKDGVSRVGASKLRLIVTSFLQQCERNTPVLPVKVEVKEPEAKDPTSITSPERVLSGAPASAPAAVPPAAPSQPATAASEGRVVKRKGKHQDEAGETASP
jgi:hypothetical protein